MQPKSILRYRHVLTNDLATFDDPGVFDLIATGLTQLQHSTSPAKTFATLADYEKFPNLRDLYDTVEHPFRRIAAFRNSATSQAFRAWLPTLKPGSDVEVIREYVDACAERQGLFESVPMKFLKRVSLAAVGVASGAGAAALGADEMIAAATGVAASGAAEIAGRATDFGLGIIETFIVDNFKVGWSPKAYFDGLRKISGEPRARS